MVKQKIDPFLLNLISMLSSGARQECFVSASDYQRLRKVIKLRGIPLLNEYLFIKSFHVKLTKAEMASFSKMSQVKFISHVASASALMNISKKILGADNIPLAGEGQTVAIIDTGVSRHPDFCLGENRITYFKDFISSKTEPYDDNGHGTFVAGVCAGNGALSKGYYAGIAPKAKIVSLKALNGRGEASADKILEAMEWVYDNHKKFNIKVVCMSFGSEPLGYNDPIMAGAEALWDEGVVVVAAAGNSGPEFQTIKSPGVSSKIITVGGFNDNRLDEETFNHNFFEVADFSSRGPAFSRFKPDLIAPSVDIISCGIKKPYTSLSGTSVATPMIAGICLLMFEKDESLSPNTLKRILMTNCKPISYNKNLEGLGYPNLQTLFRINQG